MGWLKKKQGRPKREVEDEEYLSELPEKERQKRLQQIREEENSDDDFENETEDVEENQIKNIKQNVMKPVSQIKSSSDNLVIPFASPAREGLRTSDGKILADDIWTALAEIINMQNKILKIISE